MYHYQYVSRKEAEPYRKQVEEIIHQVQDLVRDKFTFRYSFIGSSARDMITCDDRTNQGFDFDINIYPNDDDNIYGPDQLKRILINALNQIAPRYGLLNCEDSTRVITIKKVHPWTRVIIFSFDIAIVHDYDGPHGEPRQEYIHFNKKQHSYTWKDQPTGGYHLTEKAEWIKSQNGNLWNDVRKLYLYKKNTNTNPEKRSRSLYAETIHEICQLNGYFH